MSTIPQLKCTLCKEPIPTGDKMAVGNGGAYCMTCWNCRKFDCMSVDQAATRDGIERAEAMAFADSEQAALAVWDYLGPKCLEVVERVLAAQGDAPERELIQLQHELSEILQPQLTQSPHVEKI